MILEIFPLSSEEAIVTSRFARYHIEQDNEAETITITAPGLVRVHSLAELPTSSLTALSAFLILELEQQLL